MNLSRFNALSVELLHLKNYFAHSLAIHRKEKSICSFILEFWHIFLYNAAIQRTEMKAVGVLKPRRTHLTTEIVILRLSRLKTRIFSSPHWKTIGRRWNSMAVTKEATNGGSGAPISSIAALCRGVPVQYGETVAVFLDRMGVNESIKPEHDAKDSFSSLVGGVLEVISVERGKISCLLNVKAPILNAYGGMHGGAVAAVAERVATACARTVVGKDKDIFLGELSISYLSAAPHKADVVVDASVVRSGRNLTVVVVDFRLKESGRLAFMTRSTFYNMPISSL